VKCDVTFEITVCVDLSDGKRMAIERRACDKLIATINERACPENIVEISGLDYGQASSEDFPRT
jgi:hypothetical protein